jgi:putative ubiquitin-RnfH superfamily antitoxin RatB of RatAB toxin-antitoxin module
LPAHGYPPRPVTHQSDEGLLETYVLCHFTGLAQIRDEDGILDQFPEIDLDKQKVGIFGKLTQLGAPVTDGERIEIYREITADPEMVERRDL